jgi:hypothetical protein
MVESNKEFFEDGRIEIFLFVSVSGVQEFDKLWELTKVKKERCVVELYEIGVDSMKPYGKISDFIVICIEKRHMSIFCFS